MTGSVAAASAQPLLELRQVSKRYGGVKALTGVDFACRAGTIHAILGENGAGKSTLIKTVAGVVQPSEGQILLEGAPMRFGHPVEANQAGIVCVFQELSLLPTLSVAENIGISAAPNRLGLLNKKAQLRGAEELLARVGCIDVNPRARVSDLSLSQRQMVEIAKALGKKPRLLILDEATSALTASHVETVFRILKQLRSDGLALLYISHRWSEIKELADVMSVFRNGQHIETFAKDAHTDQEIVQLMIGRDVGHAFPPKPARKEPREPLLQVKDLNWEQQLRGVTFSLGKGEILGIGGLDGQGQKDLLLGLFGVLKGMTGTLTLAGQEVQITSPHQAKSRKNRVALVPDDRKTEGLMLPMSIRDNMVLASLARFTRGASVSKSAEDAAVQEMLGRLQIKIGALKDPVSSLSGGNQQKVVLAKWLMTEPQVLMLNDPTRGIDVGTKQELYRLFRELADAGTSILLYSTDYDELIGLCDRALIFYQGRIVRELVGEEITETNIVASSLNLEVNADGNGSAPNQMEATL